MIRLTHHQPECWLRLTPQELYRERCSILQAWPKSLSGSVRRFGESTGKLRQQWIRESRSRTIGMLFRTWSQLPDIDATACRMGHFIFWWSRAQD
jgi:hypothetical protein